MEDPDVLYWNALGDKTEDFASSSSSSSSPVWMLGASLGFVASAAVVCVAPMLWGLGAPFAPTTLARQHVMMELVLRHVPKQQPNDRCLLYDLGSGDGRLVLAAARQYSPHIFTKCIGCEINPVWHTVACIRRFVQGPWVTSQLVCRDLWTYRLPGETVAVTLYAYPPIMTRLGQKLQAELSPGAVVVSSQYPIPHWKPVEVNVDEQIYLYRMPPILADESSSLPSRESRLDVTSMAT